MLAIFKVLMQVSLDQSIIHTLYYYCIIIAIYLNKNYLSLSLSLWTDALLLSCVCIKVFPEANMKRHMGTHT